MRHLECQGTSSILCQPLEGNRDVVLIGHHQRSSETFKNGTKVKSLGFAPQLVLPTCAWRR